MKVAVVLTGQLRYTDWCYQWWKSVAEESQHDITFYSSTWLYEPGHSQNISFVQSRNRNQVEKVYNNDISKMFDDVSFTTSDQAELQKYFKQYLELEEYLTYPKESNGYSREKAFTSFQYHFGRLYHVSKAVNDFNLTGYDKIVHSRWDCLVKPKNFDLFIDKGWRFAGITKDPDPMNPSELLHSNDLIYSGDASDFIKLYSNPHELMKFVCDTAMKHKQNDWLIGSKYIIGHCLFVNHIVDKCRVAHNITVDSTLFRNYQVPFKYNIDTWKNCLYCYNVDIGHIRDNRLLVGKIFQS